MSSKPLTQFHLFPSLPPELRLKIWSYSHHPRTIPIECEKAIVSASKPRRFVKAFTSPIRPPSILQICRESREEALPLYTALFRTSYSKGWTYICLPVDTVFIPDSTLGYLGRDEICGIQRLKLEVHDCTNFSHYHLDTIMEMRALKELDLVIDENSTSLSVRGGEPANIPSARVLEYDFSDRKLDRPGWEAPEIRILGKHGELLGRVEGGALVPGWVIGDELPDNLGGLL
jgi:hypothetical protein